MGISLSTHQYIMGWVGLSTQLPERQQSARPRQVAPGPPLSAGLTTLLHPIIGYFFPKNTKAGQ